MKQRTTAADWYELIMCTPPWERHKLGPLAATTAELQALEVSTHIEQEERDRHEAEVVARYGLPPRPPIRDDGWRAPHTTILGYRIVEIPDWPDWLDDGCSHDGARMVGDGYWWCWKCKARFTLDDAIPYVPQRIPDSTYA